MTVRMFDRICDLALGTAFAFVAGYVVWCGWVLVTLQLVIRGIPR
jgi:hypothetical protein